MVRLFCRLLLGCGVLMLAVRPARAQFAVYATLSPVHVSNVQTGSVQAQTGFVNQYTSVTPVGIGGGVSYNFLPLHVVSFGFDLRGSTKPGTTGADTVLAGFKVGVHPPLTKIKLYVQASAGYLAVRALNQSTGATVNSTFENNYIAFEGIVGVDYSILPFIDFRVGEIGVGRGLSTRASFQGMSRDATLLTINSGIVFHF